VGRGGARERDIFDFEASVCSLLVAAVPFEVRVSHGRLASHGPVVYVALLCSTCIERVTAFSALDALWSLAFGICAFVLIVDSVENFTLQVHVERCGLLICCGDLSKRDVRARITPISI